MYNFVAIIKTGFLKCDFDPQDPCTYGMPTMDDFMVMRNSYNQEKGIRTLDNKSSFLLYYYFLLCAGSVRIFGYNSMHKHTISKIFSPSLEG